MNSNDLYAFCMEYIYNSRASQSANKHRDARFFATIPDISLVDKCCKIHQTTLRLQHYNSWHTITKNIRGQQKSQPHYKLRSVNFYFTDVSEPSHIIITRSIFILPTSQNRHSSHLRSFLYTIIITDFALFVNLILKNILIKNPTLSDFSQRVDFKWDMRYSLTD